MNDLRFGVRQLLKNPGFTAVAVLTLALGIGANTAIFTLIDHVVLRGLQVRDRHQVFTIQGNFSYAKFDEFRRRNTVCAGLVGTHALLEMEYNLSGLGIGQAKAELVTGNYFELLGVRAGLGRVLQPDDDRVLEGSPVAVISHRFWQQALAGTPEVIGTTIRVRSGAGNAGTSGLDIYDGAARRSVEGAILTIVGVAPPDFFGDTIGVATDLWIPMMMQPAVMPGRPWLDKKNVSFVNILGRLRPEVSEAQARSALLTVWHQLLMDEAGATLTEEQKRRINLRTFEVDFGGQGYNQFRGGLAQWLQILMAAAATVLLIACLNVANLLLARGSARRQELGVRLALGAGRAQLLRQLVTENLLLAGAGGTVSLLFAFVGLRLLVTLASSGYQALDLPTRPDWRALGFATAVSVLTTLLFGLGPAWQALRARCLDSLQGGTRSASSQRQGRLGRVLVGIQVAASMALLIGAGLLVRSFHNLRTQDVGYDPDPLVMMWLDPVSAGFHGDEIGRVCQTVVERIRALPGVAAAAYSENGLFYGPESNSLLEVDGFSPSTDAEKRVWFDQAGPGYFATVGIPLLLGRDFSERDGPKSPRVTVINESLAKFYFAGRNPVGQRVKARIGPQIFDLEVIGVARDVQDHSFWWKAPRRFYVPFLHPIDGLTAANFTVRTAGNTAGLDALLRREVQAVHPGLMVLRIRPLHTLMDQSLADTRLIARLSTVFAILAAALAAIGLYGIIAFEVTRRKQEIGVRMALGAQRRDVFSWVLRRSMIVVFLGIGAGALSSLGLTRALEAWLYELKPTDPWTLSVTPILMVAIALFACWWPARRASRLDPMEALRHE